MKQKDLISQDCLESIHAALGHFAPDLQHHIVTLVKRGYVNTRAPARGESIYPDYRVSMSVEDANAILEALRAIEKERGFNFVFRERQINFLVSEWAKQVERLRTSPNSEASVETNMIPPPELDLFFPKVNL